MRAENGRLVLRTGGLMGNRGIYNMYYSPNSLRGGIQGSIIGVMKGDTRSLDYRSYVMMFPYSLLSPGKFRGES